MRWATPFLFCTVGAFVAYHNTYRVEDTGSWIVFPFLRSLVGPEPQALSQATVGLLLAIAALTALSSWRGARRASADAR